MGVFKGTIGLVVAAAVVVVLLVAFPAYQLQSHQPGNRTGGMGHSSVVAPLPAD